MMRRFILTLTEMLVELLLLGLFFVLLFVATQERSWSVILFSSAPVFLVLFLHGYYITRPLLGILWKYGRPALYAALAAALYMIQMYIAYVRLKPDVMPEAAAKVFPWLTGGAAIVFGCALIGRLQLRRWSLRASRIRASDG